MITLTLNYKGGSIGEIYNVEKKRVIELEEKAEFYINHIIETNIVTKIYHIIKALTDFARNDQEFALMSFVAGMAIADLKIEQ